MTLVRQNNIWIKDTNLWTKQIEGIDVKELAAQCLAINDEIHQTLKDKPHNYKIDDNTPFGTRVADYYNVFCYPSQEINRLYRAIREAFYATGPMANKTYYIQGWVNVYEKGQFINWHRHAGKRNSYHGFFCVNSNVSSTQYRFYDGTEREVESKDGLLVFSHSDNNFHRTTPCNDETPRITIGFDIHTPGIILKALKQPHTMDHWTPI